MNLKNLGWNSFLDNHLTAGHTTNHHIGRVITVQKGAFLVQTETEPLTATLSGNMRYQAEIDGDLPVVGDWVELSGDATLGAVTVTAIIPRLNKLSRHAAVGAKGQRGPVREQAIAANIDLIFIVCGLDRDYNLRRIERYLTLAYNSGSTPIVVLNKSDLCEDTESRQIEVEAIAPGVKTHTLSAHDPNQLEQLTRYMMPGVTAALLGSSGAGKSTIVNGLLGKERQQVHTVSEAVGKGRHTTTHRELIVLPTGGMIIDNPGIRELQIWEDDDGLETVFDDIEQLAESCRFSDCNHDSEPGCAVREAIEKGDLDADRLQSYQKLKREIAWLDDRKTKSGRANDRIKGKAFARLKKEVIQKKHGSF